MPIRKKKISELSEAGDLKGFYTIGYRIVDGLKESVKIGLEYIQTAYEKVVQATKDAIAATTDMRQLEATVEGNEEARETAESRRAAAEQGRQTAESVRSSAEDERIGAEESRLSAETARSTAEDVRKAAELLRTGAETERSTAEQSRKTAESGRVAAEQARVTEYAGIKAESEDVIAAHRSAVASANQAAIYANQEGDIAKEKAALADAAAQAANTAATTIDDKMQIAINKLIAGAPDALDTLNELAAALGNDPNFATTIATELGKKLNKTDIVNDVVTGGVDKVLSAQQGVELAGQIVEMSKNAGGKMVLIPSDVLNLSNTSTSNEILDAFGSKEAFIDIVTKVKEGAPAAINADGVLAPISVYSGIIVEEQNLYTLAFLAINPIETVDSFMASITFTGDIATVDKLFYPYGYANIVNIPSDVVNLAPGSTSDQIIAAFGGRVNFDKIIEKIREGNASVLFSGLAMGMFPVAMCASAVVSRYVDKNTVDVTIYQISNDGTINNFTIEVMDSVFRIHVDKYHLMQSSELVSNPSTGGTDVPASAEAVKVVNDKVATIQGKIDDGSLKGDKGDKGDTGATGPQGPQGPSGNSFLEGVVTKYANGLGMSRVMVGNNGSAGDPGILLAVGDTDSGLHSTTDGTVLLYANSVNMGSWNSGGFYLTVASHATGGFWKDSDARLKSHITPLRHTLDQILAIPTSGFLMNGKQQIGTIAQEVEKICPEVVSESLELKSQVPDSGDWEVFIQNDYEGKPREYVKVKRVEYEMLGVLALEGVKLLAKEVEELRNRLKELER